MTNQEAIKILCELKNCYLGGIVDALDMAIEAVKAQEPRVMTWDEVKKKINSGEYVFTECKKEGQWMRCGNAKLSIDQGDSCRIAFLSSGDREDNPHVLWWWVSYKNYNKTWRCWTICPTRAEGGDTVKCTKINCPIQAGTPTDNCGENCPWRTIAKTDDLVSKAAVIEAILGSFNAIRAIEELHAVDAIPVVHGRWINIPDKPEWDQKMCSVCGDYFCCQNNFYPNCGAKMDGGESE